MSWCQWGSLRAGLEKGVESKKKERPLTLRGERVMLFMLGSVVTNMMKLRTANREEKA